MSRLVVNQLEDIAGTNPISVADIASSVDLAANGGSALVGYLPAGTGAIATNVQTKLRESVSVKDFGAVGDGVTDDAGAVSAAIAHLFTTNGNTLFFPDGVYYFASPVTVTFTSSYARGLRLVGTSMPGFVNTRPGGSRITGASGLTSLFTLTKTPLTTFGGYSFECENIDFNGNSLAVGSAILNLIGGGPMRPFNVRSCNFVGFQKAIYSDISGTGLTTGICQVNIEGSSFVENGYALYGKGQGSIMDLRFVGNVCEQNSLGGIYSESLGILGTVTITDNLLEGQANAIYINVGLTQILVARNYFESNTGDAIYIAGINSGSQTEIGPNYYLNCAGCEVYVAGGLINNADNFTAAGMNFDARPTNPQSTLNNVGQLVPRSWTGHVYAFGLDSTQIANKVAPAVIDSGAYIDFTAGPEETPLGQVFYAANAGAGPIRLTSALLDAGDAIVAVCLARVASGTPNIALYVYDNASNSLTNTPVAGPFTNRIQVGQWFLLVATIKVPSSSAGACRVRWITSGGTIDTTKTYTYKIAAPVDKSTPLYLYMPYFSPLFGSSTYDPPSLNDGAGNTTTVTVTGAALGDIVDAVSFSNDLQGIMVTGWVSAANTVSVRFQNETGGTLDLASGTLRVRVTKL